MAKKQSEIYYVPQGSPVSPDKWDVRVIHKNIASALISPKELEEHLNKLPDDTAHADFRDYDAVINDDSGEGVADASGERSEELVTH